MWWTDHDFRHQALGYREEIGFDAKVEPGVPGWEWTYRQEGVGPTEPSTDFVDDPRSADEAGKAMRVAATGEKRGWSYVLREATAYNYTYTRTLAGTAVGLDVLLEQSGADALAVIRVQSSYLPASGGRGAGYYTVEYRLGGTEGRWTQDGGRSLVVGLPADPGLVAAAVPRSPGRRGAGLAGHPRGRPRPRRAAARRPLPTQQPRVRGLRPAPPATPRHRGRRAAGGPANFSSSSAPTGTRR